MRYLLTLIFILITSTTFAASLDLSWSGAYSPPGGDIVVGDKIGRYVLESELKYSDKWYRASFGLQAYGVTDWLPPSERGHGIDKFQGDYAWQVDGWRFATTQRLEIGKPELYFFVFNYMPLDRGNWEGHGTLVHYYYLIGVGGTLNLWSD